MTSMKCQKQRMAWSSGPPMEFTYHLEEVGEEIGVDETDEGGPEDGRSGWIARMTTNHESHCHMWMKIHGEYWRNTFTLQVKETWRGIYWLILLKSKLFGKLKCILGEELILRIHHLQDSTESRLHSFLFARIYVKIIKRFLCKHTNWVNCIWY